MFQLLLFLAANTGIASWYVPKQSHVNMYGTRNLVAHRSYRPGTVIVVEHNNRKVRVVVCGYGPSARTGRSIDLSGHAFGQLASRDRGVIPVKWRVISGKPSSVEEK